MFARVDIPRRAAPACSSLAAPYPHRMRLAAGVTGASALLVLLLGMLAHPASAHAEVPVVGPVVKAIGEGVETVLNPAEAVVKALLKVLQAIFGGIEAKLITGVINGLLAIPRFDTGHVAALEHTTVAIAAGMLSAVLTLSILRYYLAGLTDSGSGGFEAIQGLVRVIGAVGFIIAWPSVFAEVAEIPKAFDGALLGAGSVQHSVALLFDAALVVGASAFAIDTGLGLIYVVLIAFIAAVVFIALLWMKVLVSTMMMFLYVSMPLCVVLWPVQELSWLAVAAMRALFVALVIPCVWAILFALSAAVNADVLTWAPSHSIIDTVIIRPLAGITLMLLCITIPRFLIRTAMIGPHGQANGGWRVWRTVTFGMFAMRGAAGVGQTVAAAAAEGQPAAQRMIDKLPTQLRPPSEPGQGTLAGRIVFGRSGFPKTGKTPDRSSMPAAGQGDAETGGGNGGSSGAPAGEGTVRPEMQLAGVTPAGYDRRRIDRAGEEMYAQAGSTPSSATDVTAAMAKLAPETQRAISDFRNNDHLKLRDLMAHNLHAPSLTQEQHEALWTIGTARQAEARAGIDQAITNLESQQPSASSSGQTGQGASQDTHVSGASSSDLSAPATPSADGRPSIARSPEPVVPGSPSTVNGGSAGTPPQQAGSPSGSSAAAGNAAPSLSSSVPSPSENGQEGSTLSTDLPQQPAGAGETSTSPGPELPDIEPFLD